MQIYKINNGWNNTVSLVEFQLNSLTVHQRIAITRLAMAILMSASIFLLIYLEGRLRKRVSVIYDNDKSKTHFMSVEKVNGQAQVTYTSYLSSNAVVTGTFKEGVLEGSGVIAYPIGSIAEERGEFRQGRLVKGKISYRNGNIATGEFHLYKLVAGTITYSGGQVEQVDKED